MKTTTMTTKMVSRGALATMAMTVMVNLCPERLLLA
jgi:hypothetical protein